MNDIRNMDCIEYIQTLADNSIDLIILDPPYGNIVKAKWDTEETMNLQMVNECFRVLKPTGNLYCWAGIGEKSQSLIRFFNIFSQSKFIFKDMIVWKKNRGMGNRKGWLFTREEILWYVKDNKSFKWNIDKQYSEEKRPWNIVKSGGKMVNKSEYKRWTNVWIDINEAGFGKSPTKFNEIRTSVNHPTPKPIEAIKRIITLHTNENDIILDPFLGSGTTLQAAIDLNRQCFGCEKDNDIFEWMKSRIKENELC